MNPFLGEAFLDTEIVEVFGDLGPQCGDLFDGSGSDFVAESFDDLSNAGQLFGDGGLIGAGGDRSLGPGLPWGRRDTRDQIFQCVIGLVRGAIIRERIASLRRHRGGRD